MVQMFDVPILYIIYNRLEYAKTSFKQIQYIKPSVLYITADGPKVGNFQDYENCNLVREWVLSNITWKCEVHTSFLQSNLGCGKAVFGAIKWFFSQVKYGIVLEDDIVASFDFFTFCKLSLEKYYNHSHVALICGYNPRGGNITSENTFFSYNPSLWGWATWSDRLFDFDFELLDWPNDKVKSFLTSHFPYLVQKYFIDSFNLTKYNKIDTWDYQLTYLIFKREGLTLKPYSNLITNIGLFGTHSAGLDHNHNISFGKINLKTIRFPVNYIVDNSNDINHFNKILMKDNVNEILRNAKSLISNIFKNCKKYF